MAWRIKRRGTLTMSLGEEVACEDGPDGFALCLQV